MKSNAQKQAEKERLLTAERLREIFTYEPETGVFRWRVARGKARPGMVAGRFSGKGYRQLLVDGMFFYAQRLAWLYVTGQWPSGEIDHDDLDKTNNRFKNLRVATDIQNQGNRPANRNNGSGVKGVRWYAKTSKWQARISVNSKSQHLGYFDSKDDAAAAYAQAAQNRFGKFARVA